MLKRRGMLTTKKFFIFPLFKFTLMSTGHSCIQWTEWWCFEHILLIFIKLLNLISFYSINNKFKLIILFYSFKKFRNKRWSDSKYLIFLSPLAEICSFVFYSSIQYIKPKNCFVFSWFMIPFHMRKMFIFFERESKEVWYMIQIINFGLAFNIFCY